MRSLDNLRLLLADINWPEITSHVSGNNWNVLDGDWLDSWHRAVYAACDAAEADYAELRHDLSTARGALDIAVKNEIAAERERDELRGKIDSMLVDGKPMTDENMLVDGWIRLPKDADGEYIRIGDAMDSKVDYLFDGRPFDVRALVLLEDGWEVADGRFGNRYEPNSLRHHHIPTVEDVLREFYSRYCTTKPKEEDDAILAEFAAKLRLAGDGA